MNKITKHTQIAVPQHMKDLSVTDLGYLKPWFVKEDDFRVVDGKKAWLSVNKKACWICGHEFESSEFAMVGDAKSAVLRIYTEPPCHVDCAVYAAQVCPFMLYPMAKRRVAGIPEDLSLGHRNENQDVKIGGDNPGQYYILVVSDFEFDREKQFITFSEDKIIDTQLWVGGVKQSAIPNPIVYAE